MAYVFMVASLAGLLVRRGPITAVVGSSDDFRRLARVRLMFVTATAIASWILVNTTVPTGLRFGVFVAAELVFVGLFLAILPSRRFHRARGVLPNLRTWKRGHGVKDAWMLYALIHDPETPADELQSAVRSLMPELRTGSAAVVCTTSDSQVRALELLGFIRESPTSGLLFRKATDARTPVDDGLEAEPV